ncbi:Hypothetical predicted protein [Marmota monax]|uniref:Uncharacterized protein n=1 Tax=Marmota monax TaxID=9995 RepID=A0A5E4A0U7_MARMO|nr:hypothetical protein GHT09_011566 [Marmota monax]VTJ50848.1 Hypothetical predicted protein [Marmota monax]
MTKDLKRHKQVGECAGGGQEAGEYIKEEARPQRADKRRQGVGLRRRSKPRSHLDRTQVREACREGSPQRRRDAPATFPQAWTSKA